MRGPGRADIVNAGSGRARYSECGVRGEQILGIQGPGRTDIVNAGVQERRYWEYRVQGLPHVQNGFPIRLDVIIWSMCSAE
ncbi:unnamed protein product, partial [Staurois parvus]